jgi:hypothetical protein
VEANTSEDARAGGVGDGRRRPEISIVVPAFNEAARLGDGVSRLQAAVDQGAVDPSTTELIVVDDGSRDDTIDRARELLAPFPHLVTVVLPKNTGKGAAVRAGMALVRSPLALFTDADMSIDPAQIPAMVAALAHADVAIGRRSAPGSGVDRDSLLRNIGGRTFNRIANTTMRISFGDTQCGFKAFRTPVARLLFHCTVIERFAFDVELLYMARRLGLTVVEVPVRWQRIQGSRIRPIRDPLSMVTDVALSRSGIRPPPPVEGVVVTSRGGGPGAPAKPVGEGGPGAMSRLLDACGPEVTLVSVRDRTVLALFPLADATGVEQLAERVRTVLGVPDAPRTTVTVSQLAAMAPLVVESAGGHVVAGT